MTIIFEEYDRFLADKLILNVMRLGRLNIWIKV